MKKRMSPGQIIVLGFLSIIAVGTLLFMLPFSQAKGANVGFVDALFTSASAVCVTGLSTFDVGSTLSPFGQVILALLIQLGGLGFSCISIGFALLMGQRILIKQRSLVKESLNYGSMGGIVLLVRSVLITTVAFELTGAVLSFFVFIKEYPLGRALGLSIFHSVSAFNNAGFDIFGNGNSLVNFSGNVPLLLITSFLIISGGIGFLVIKEIVFKRKFKKFSLHTKVVLTATLLLVVIGTLLIKLSDDFSWLDSFFLSVSTRTAGFSSVDLGGLSNTGAIICAILMFIGASPTSTGGGIKTTTFFVMLAALKSYVSASKTSIYKRTLQKDVVHKAFIILTLGLLVILTSLFLLSLAEPSTDFKSLFFEVISAFGTVGLSTGITPGLSLLGKYIIIVTMFVGRLGPLTIISLWIFKKQSGVSYAEDTLTLG